VGRAPVGSYEKRFISKELESFSVKKLNGSDVLQVLREAIQARQKGIIDDESLKGIIGVLQGLVNLEQNKTAIELFERGLLPPVENASEKPFTANITDNSWSYIQ